MFECYGISRTLRIFSHPLAVIYVSLSLMISVDAALFEPVALSMDDFKNAEMLTKDEVFKKEHVPIEDVNGHRTDIRGPVADRIRVKRNGVSRVGKMWPGGRIPYAISPHYNSHERALLARAVKQYHDKTCIRFVPRQSGEGDYLFIGKVDGCFSEVGRTNGVQVLSLDNGCMEYATIIHEMMHVVGFYHEHERWDRDSYIDIIWQNIDRAALDQFGKVDLSKTSYYGQPYDYKSILHYDSLAFSKNGFPTMLPKKPGLASTIGNAKDFSEVDLAKINRMYNCPVRQPARAQAQPLYHPQAYGNKYHQGYNYAQRPRLEGHSFYDEDVVVAKPHHLNVPCEDKITVCWWTQDRCMSPNIYVMMKSLCAKTCKFC